MIFRMFSIGHGGDGVRQPLCFVVNRGMPLRAHCSSSESGVWRICRSRRSAIILRSRANYGAGVQSKRALQGGAMAARITNKLTAVQVTNLSRPGGHSDGAGLYLSIDIQGRRRWVFLFRWQGKLTEVGLGGAAGKQRTGLSLSQARQKAEDCRRWVRQGSNPKDMRQSPSQVPTFGVAADALNRQHRSWLSEREAPRRVGGYFGQGTLRHDKGEDR